LDNNATGFGYFFLTLIRPLFCGDLFHDLQRGIFESSDEIGNHSVIERSKRPFAYFWKVAMESSGALFIFIVWIGATVGLGFKFVALLRPLRGRGLATNAETRGVAFRSTPRSGRQRKEGEHGDGGKEEDGEGSNVHGLEWR
jgi:hypothetical protein